MRQQSWRDYRAQAKASGDVDLVELLDAGITAKQLDHAFETVCLHEDVEFPPGDAKVPDGKTDVDGDRAVLERADVAAPGDDRSGDDVPDATASGAIRASLARVCSAATAIGRCWSSCSGAGSHKPERHPKAVGCRSGLPSRPSSCTTISGLTTVQPYLTAWRQYLYGRCISLLVKARESATAERRRRNALNFNDLLILTAKVLRENADVRRALQQKYRWLFVDEFQDTDPVQAEIMLLLAADEDAPAGALRPGALFVVGDPKQSIYRFRRADIDIYNEVRARLGGADGSGIVRLTTNFRSVPGLCTWANDVFKDRFPATPTKQAPAFAPLHDYREAGGRTRDRRSRLAGEHQGRRSYRRRRPSASRGTSEVRSKPVAAPMAIS